MNDDSVHKPELPGVRTLEKDSKDEKADFSFGGIKLTMPSKESVPLDDTATHKGGSVSGGKATFDIERAFNDENVQEGTIVTDRKRKHTTAGAMLKSAWGEWWGNTKHSVEKRVDTMEFLKPKEVPKVETVEHRANIIQEAAQYAKQAPRDDHSIIVEKVRTYAHDAEVVTGKPFTIKEPTEKIGAHWSKPKEEERPEPEPKGPVPTLDMRTATVAQDVARSSSPLGAYAPKVTAPLKKAPTPTVVVTEKPSIASLRTPEKMHGRPNTTKAKGGWSFFKDEKAGPVDFREKVGTVRKDVVVPRVETPSTPIVPRVREAVPERVAVARESVPEPENVVEVVEDETPIETIAPTERGQHYAPSLASRAASPERMSILSVIAQMPRSLIIVSIIVVGGGLGVLTALMVLNTADTPSGDVVVAPVTLATYVSTDNDVPIPLGSTRGVLYEAIDREMDIEHGTVVQYYPTITEGGVTTPVRTDAIMRTLAFEIPGSFVRALSPSMMIGGVRTERYEPFMILHSSNFDVAFAGMLSWEAKMAVDLSPLFGTLPQGGSFTDALADNRSIRILRDETGKEHIVYAFLNRDLVIITTSSESLSALIERLR